MKFPARFLYIYFLVQRGTIHQPLLTAVGMEGFCTPKITLQIRLVAHISVLHTHPGDPYHVKLVFYDTLLVAAFGHLFPLGITGQKNIYNSVVSFSHHYGTYCKYYKSK